MVIFNMIKYSTAAFCPFFLDSKRAYTSRASSFYQKKCSKKTAFYLLACYAHHPAMPAIGMVACVESS